MSAESKRSTDLKLLHQQDTEEEEEEEDEDDDEPEKASSEADSSSDDDDDDDDDVSFLWEGEFGKNLRNASRIFCVCEEGGR